MLTNPSTKVFFLGGSCLWTFAVLVYVVDSNVLWILSKEKSGPIYRTSSEQRYDWIFSQYWRTHVLPDILICSSIVGFPSIFRQSCPQIAKQSSIVRQHFFAWLLALNDPFSHVVNSTIVFSGKKPSRLSMVRTFGRMG